MANAVDQAYNAIRERIINGDADDGAKLRASDIAEQLGISRTPVREALRRLGAEGLVNLVANHGAYIAQFDSQEIEEVFNLRIMLESYAVELGAKYLTADKIENLAILDNKMRQLVSARPTGFVDKVRQHNLEFHRIIIEGSMNRRLAALIAAVSEVQLVRFTYQKYSDSDFMRSMDNHSELVEALRARNPEWASSVMKVHLYAAKHVATSHQHRARSAAIGM